MYYNFAEVAGDGSLLMALEDKGEGKGRVTCQTLVSAYKIQISDILSSCFWRNKSSSVGRIDPGGSRYM